MSLALELWFGLPLFLGYVLSAVVVVPLVTHGITFISRLQLWTQPVWIILHVLPFAAIAIFDAGSFTGWAHYGGGGRGGGVLPGPVLFGCAPPGGVLLSPAIR